MFEYIDDLSLNRALELLEFWRREAGAIRRAQRKASDAASRGLSPDESVGEGAAEGFGLGESSEGWVPPTEKDAEGQFAFLHGAMVPRRPDGSPILEAASQVSRIPDHLREAIRWAEEFKGKHKLS